MAKEIETPKSHKVLVGAMMEQSSYSGPLPKPSDFAAYKETLPSAPERIMKMAEEEQEHRQHIEKEIIKSVRRENLVGQIIGFVLALVCLCVATYLGLQGHDALAGAIMAISAVLASIFYLKKVPKKEELNKNIPC